MHDQHLVLEIQSCTWLFAGTIGIFCIRNVNNILHLCGCPTGVSSRALYIHEGDSNQCISQVFLRPCTYNHICPISCRPSHFFLYGCLVGSGTSRRRFRISFLFSHCVGILLGWKLLRNIIVSCHAQCHAWVYYSCSNTCLLSLTKRFLHFKATDSYLLEVVSLPIYHQISI